MFQKIKNFVRRHKVWSAIIVIAILAAGYWYFNSRNSTTTETRYVTAKAAKGTVIVSISGTGQVSASNQFEIKPKASGDVVYVGVVAGQQVKAGTLVAKLDTTSAEKAVRDAEVSLESAQIALDKIRGPLGSAVPRNKDQAEQDLIKTYDDGFNSVSNAFLDLPGIMSGLHDILYSDTYKKGQDNISAYSDAVKDFDPTIINYKNDSDTKYQTARTAYDQNFTDYKNASRYSSTTTVESLISETYDTTKTIAEAVKSANNYLQFHKDLITTHNLKVQTIVDTYLANLNSYTGTTNSHLVDLLNIVNTIRSDEDAILNADLDLRTSEINVTQRQNALIDAKDNLNDYYVRAPFDGTIAALNVKKYDSASSGTSVATLITSKKIAEISLNEVDAASIKVGQKVTLTFDAVPNLSIAGEVSQIDTIGTVSQGVVTYTVQISFDTEDDRVKPGMSVSASVVTNIVQDVLTVPNGAIKTQTDGSTYVEIFDTPLANSSSGQGAASAVLPKEVPVTIGLSNDTLTEIKSGLKEGDQVVSRTITSQTKTTTSTTPSLFGGGGAVRAIGR